VTVNEVLTHTVSPLEDAVEFYNSTAGTLNIGGWFISNSQDDLKKYRIADNTTIPANGFKVFYAYQFNPTNGSSTPFIFDAAHGDNVYLSQADAVGNLTGYRPRQLWRGGQRRLFRQLHQQHRRGGYGGDERSILRSE